MEGPKVSHSVRPYFSLVPITVAQLLCDRRSHLPNGVKTKSWQDRMEQAKKAQAIKRLQQELKDEKQAEITRYAAHSQTSHIALIKFPPYYIKSERNYVAAQKSGRRTTASRRRQGQGSPLPPSMMSMIRHLHVIRWVLVRQLGYGEKQVVPRRSTASSLPQDTVFLHSRNLCPRIVVLKRSVLR